MRQGGPEARRAVAQSRDKAALDGPEHTGQAASILERRFEEHIAADAVTVAAGSPAAGKSDTAAAHDFDIEAAGSDTAVPTGSPGEAIADVSPGAARSNAEQGQAANSDAGR